jgi:DNA modification methylase
MNQKKILEDNIEAHTLAAIFPMMSSDEIWQLAKDIAKNGLQEPVILFEGKLLDGRNRVKACNMINCPIEYIELESDQDAFLYVISKNLHRRHLTSAQKAKLGLILLEEELKRREDGCSEHPEQRAYVKIATQLGISDKTLKQYKQIDDYAKEDEEIAKLQEKMLKPKTDEPPSIKKIHQQIQRKRREEEETKAMLEIELTNEHVIHDSVVNYASYFDKESIDLIVTDPPYYEEYLWTYQELFKAASYILKEGSFLITYASQQHLDEIMKMDFQYLKYVWTYALIHTGAKNVCHPAKVKIGWKPLLVFVKGKLPDIPYFEDILMGTGREKNLHKWQQALGEASELIKIFSKAGDVVLDPFVGSGTTMIAAKMLKRDSYGMDVDEQAIKTTIKRLDET